MFLYKSSIFFEKKISSNWSLCSRLINTRTAIQLDASTEALYSSSFLTSMDDYMKTHYLKFNVQNKYDYKSHAKVQCINSFIKHLVNNCKGHVANIFYQRSVRVLYVVLDLDRSLGTNDLLKVNKESKIWCTNGTHLGPLHIPDSCVG